MNKWTRPQDHRQGSAGHAEGRRARAINHYYFAFLSYSHEDTKEADWLHDELERFRVPASLVGKLTASGVVPHHLTPIFRDRHELAAGHSLTDEIRVALSASRCLIVLCSPSAAKSKWTNAEIETFKRVHPDGTIIAAVIAGEPLASDIPGREDEECFPPALVAKYNRRGKPTGQKTEPMAADLREGKGGRRIGFLKIVAGLLGVGLDELVQRDTIRRQRRLAWLAAASIGGMAITSTLAVTAIQARDAARDQRRQAEGLIGFMLGDLKDKLEPIGKLDALDGVGARVLAYYHNQPIADLSDAALSQRSSALSLMAEVATQRGNADTALRLYREAMVGTAEAMRRNPHDPQPIFDHAQNVFYVGEIAHDRKDFRGAEASMREYQRLAQRMIALQPDSMKWRMEKQYADFNLGVALSDERRIPEAVAQFSEALRTMEAIATADPNNTNYQQQVAESLTWLADAQQAMGDFPAAIASRQRDIATMERLFRSTGDVDYQRRLIPAHRMLGTIYQEQGRPDAANAEFRAAVAVAEALVPKEPTNAVWLEYGYRARLALARQLIDARNIPEAVAQTNAACEIVGGLLKRDARNPQWNVGATRCSLLQARIALASGSKEQALKAAEAALDISRGIRGSDAVGNAYLVAEAYRLVGDIHRGGGNEEAARSAWRAGLSILPTGGFEEPDQIATRASILQRLGRSADAEPLQARLKSIGFRMAV